MNVNEKKTRSRRLLVSFHSTLTQHYTFCLVKRRKERTASEPTWRCHQNPFVGALGIQEPVILGEPQIKG